MGEQATRGLGVELLRDPARLGEAVVRGEVGFDEALRTAWQERAGREGLLRYSLAGVTRRRARTQQGSLGRFLLQCNPGRSGRRSPSRVYSNVVEPFEPEVFHFAPGWIKPEEMLLRFTLSGVVVEVLLNASPLGEASSLLVIEPEVGYPQVLEEQGLTAALAVADLSSRVDYRIGFNSLVACASVNHYHFQSLYLRGAGVEQDTLPSEQATTRPSALPGLSLLLDYPVAGWRFERTVPGGLARALARAAQALQQNNIPHNLILSSHSGVLIPRVSQHKTPVGVFPGLAFLELHGEMLLVADTPLEAEQLDRGMTEEEVERQLSSLGLAPEEFERVSQEVLRRVGES